MQCGLLEASGCEAGAGGSANAVRDGGQRVGFQLVSQEEVDRFRKICLELYIMVSYV